MNKKVKAMLLVLCALILVVGSVMGTLAYLTDTKEVVNTFTVGNVYISLDEAVLDADGKTTGTRAEAGNTNVKLIPGRSIDKDPTVTVKANSEECYVRMLVTVNYATELEAIWNNFSLATLATVDSDWTLTGNPVKNTDADTLTYEYRYNNTVAKADTDTKLDALFSKITLPGTVTNEQISTLVTKGNNGDITDQLKITVVAHAIQAEGFDTAALAWDAFTAP